MLSFEDKFVGDETLRSVMSLSKCQLSAALTRKCLSLDDKISLLDYASKHPKTGCRQLAKHFNIGKTAVANILKDAGTCERIMSSSKGAIRSVVTENIMSLMRSCIIGMGNAQAQIFIPMGPYFKRRRWRLRRGWERKN